MSFSAKLNAPWFEKIRHFFAGILVLIILYSIVNLNLFVLFGEFEREFQTGSLHDIQREKKESFLKKEEALISMDEQKEVLNWTHQDLVTAILQILENGQDQDLESLKFPFESITALHVARRSKLIFSKGESFPFHFQKGWEKHFFLGLYHGKKLFSSKISYFYPRTIGFEDFRAYQGSFQIFRRKDRYLAWYLSQTSSYSILILLDFDKLSIPNLKNKLVQTDQNLAKGTHAYNKGSLSLHKRSPLAWLIAVCIWGWFCQMGYSLRFRRRLSIRLVMAFLVFSMLMDILLILIFKELIHNRVVQIRKKLELQYENRMGMLEKGFSPFLERTGRRLSSTLRSHKIDVEEIPSFLYVVSIDRNAMVNSINREAKSLFVEGFLMGAQQVIPTFPEADIKDLQGFQKRFTAAIQSDISLSKNVRNRFIDRYRKLKRGVFHPMKLFSSSYYLYWSVVGKAESFRVFSVVGSKKEMLEAYFDWIQKQTHPGGIPFQLAALKNGQAMTLVNSLKLKENFPNLEGLLNSEQGQLTELEIHGEQYFAKRMKSKNLGDFELVFLSPKRVVHQEIKEMKYYFLALEGALILLFMLSSMVLIRIVRRPVEDLKSGFERIRRDDIEFGLEVPGKNEIAEVQSGFNSMVAELRRRRELLPFIPHKLMKLFEQDEGGFSTQICDEAAVVFSDIRSFTTISENFEPEEIVSMLNEYFSIWQRRVERYSGVIEKFIGDAVVVVFFRRNSKHFIQEAVQTSLEVMSELEDFNSKRESEGKFTIQTGIGISCSRVSLGVIGTDKKRHFIAQGSAVGTAEQLETESKHGNYTKILIDDEVYRAISHQYDLVNHADTSNSKPVYELKCL